MWFIPFSTWILLSFVAMLDLCKLEVVTHDRFFYSNGFLFNQNICLNTKITVLCGPIQNFYTYMLAN